MERCKPSLVALAVAVLVVAGTAAYVACPRNASVLKVGADAVALVSGGSPFGEGPSNTAQFSGTLAVVGNGCLGFREGDSEVAVIFPNGTRVAADADGIIIPGDARVAIGDEITGSGGGRELEGEDNWVAEQWPLASEACSGVQSVAALDDIRVVPRAGA